MTMFDNFPPYYSDQNLCKQQHFDGLGQGYSSLMSKLEHHQGFHHQSSYNFSCYYKNVDCLLETDLQNNNKVIMAEEDSRTESVNEEAGSSYSKDVVITNNNNNEDDDDDQKGWLQLSIGGGGALNGRDDERGGGGRLGLVELDLLPPGPSSGGHACRQVEFRQPFPPPSPHFPLLPQPLITNSVATPVVASPVGYISATTPTYFLQPQQPPGTSDINWAIRPVMVSGPSSSSSPFMYAPPGSRFTPQSAAAFPLLYTGVGGVAAAGPSPSLDFRVIDPPRRPHSGIWFSLQASQNQAKEPFLPQISKSYLRIKDGNMTIRLVLKYLVNKLQLENESEIEIRCRGQELPPSLTLQHVRDEIWMNNLHNHNEHPPFTLLPHPSTSATNHHLMLLLYGRKSSSSSTT